MRTSAAQQTEVLEDSNAGGGTENLCRRVPKSYRFNLICEQHAVIFLYDLVDDEHGQLVQCRHRFMQTSAVNGRDVGDEGEQSLEDLELFVDTLRNAVVHFLDDGRNRSEKDGARR